MTNSSREVLAATVRAELARKRVNQSTVAVVLGRNRVTVSSRLRGETDFSVVELHAIAEFLEIPITVFISQVAV